MLIAGTTTAASRLSDGFSKKLLEEAAEQVRLTGQAVSGDGGLSAA